MSDLRWGVPPDLRGATSDLTGGQAAAWAMMELFGRRSAGEGSSPRRAGWRVRLAGLLRLLAERLEPERAVPEPEWSGGTH